jgi:hypothetical protein
MTIKAPQTPVRRVRVGKEAEAFKRAAEAFALKATVSPQTANTTLARLGIYDLKGRLTKNYRR